jgi:hypothetical protein
MKLNYISLLAILLIGIIFISGCVQQNQNRYVCSDGSIVSDSILCPRQYTCSDGTIVTEQSKCPKQEKKLQTEFIIEPCIFCEHISISEDTVTINLNKLTSSSITSVFVDISNNGETTLGDISSGVTCSQPKHNLIPLSRMSCWPGLEEGCYLGEYNRTVTLSPKKRAVAVFYWDTNNLRQLSSSDNIVCELSIGSPQTSEIYSKNVTFNFVK